MRKKENNYTTAKVDYYYHKIFSAVLNNIAEINREELKSILKIPRMKANLVKAFSEALSEMSRPERPNPSRICMRRGGRKER